MISLRLFRRHTNIEAVVICWTIKTEPSLMICGMRDLMAKNREAAGGSAMIQETSSVFACQICATPMTIFDNTL